MKITKLIIAICFFGFLSMSAMAASYIDPTAAVVKWRNSCTVETASGPAELDNCFISTPNPLPLMTWISTIRKPNATKPLKVEIGPGTFGQPIALVCDPANGFTGYTSFEGSGVLQTTLKPGSAPVSSYYCTNLAFSNFKIVTSYHYPEWFGGGESRWNNMELHTFGGAWDEPECGPTRGKHYWYSSKLFFGTIAPGRGYLSKCDESWFFGSEIKMSKDAGSNTLGNVLMAEGNGEIHVYGGNIGAKYAINKSTATSLPPMIEAKNGGQIHIHGTGIDVEPYGDMDITVFEASAGGMIHANSAAYAINFSTPANVTRIVENGGSVMAPYNWGPMIDPVNLISKTGSDNLVETDCSATVCNNSGALPHILIYDTACSVNAGGPWRDTQTGYCRGEVR